MTRLLFSLFVFSSFSPVWGTWRKEEKFSPDQAEIVAAKVIASFVEWDDEYSLLNTRNFLSVECPSQRLRVTRQKNGSLKISFCVAFEQIRDENIDSDLQNRKKRHLFSFLSIKNAEIRWSLSSQLQLQMAKKIHDTSPMASSTMFIKNTTTFELATESPLQSVKRITVNIWQDEAAAKLISLYFSMNEKDEILRTDD